MKTKLLHLLIAFMLISLFAFNKLQAQITTQTFVYTGSLASFTVPVLCVNNVTIDARGAGGGSVSTSCVGNGGLGARIVGVVTVTTGQVLSILVGGTGQTNGSDAGGGGGSYVATGTVPLVVAGGGGGASNNIASCGSSTLLNGVNASTTTAGTANSSGIVLGGTAGNGGGAGAGAGGGGGGFYTSGTPGSGNAAGNGKGFLQGGAGGTGNSSNNGGFGGGGCGWYTGGNGGGGGGYSGGGTYGSTPYSGGGGGGSFNAGTTQTNTAGYQSGNGLIIISYQVGTPITTSATSQGLCSGNSATITANGMVSYTWSNASNATSIAITPTATTSYTVQGTNTLSCISTTVITVTVSPGVPTLAIVSSTNSTCFGKTATLTASGANTYSWSNNLLNGVSFSPSVTSAYTVTGQNGCGISNAVTTISVVPLAVSIVSSPTTICAGSPSTLIATAAATVYSWQPFSLSGPSVVVSPTSTTIYTLTVSDGTCGGFTTLVLNALPTPTITSASTSNSICAGYQVTLTASGGVNYTWTPVGIIGSTVVITPTAPTLYSVVANNTLGCLGGSSQIIITISSPTLVTSASANLICLGDAAVLSVSGANTYTWDNNSNAPTITVTPIVSTNYSVSGETNNCITIEVIPITVFIPSVTISGNTSVCNGNTISLIASGANSYTWSNGVQAAGITVAPNTNTTFVVTSLSATSGINCESTNSVQVTVLALPTVSASISKNTICKFETASLNVTGAASYTWNTGATSASFAVTPTVITIINYSVVGTGANGCENTASVSLKVNGCTGTIELNKVLNKLSIYPNPSTGNVSIEFSSAIDLKVINQLGQEIAVIQLNEDNNYKAKLQNLANGVYFIVGKNNGLKVTEKIIIQK